MRAMDLATVIRYLAIVTLLGIDQPEATVSTVLSIRLRVVSLQTSSAHPSFKKEQRGRQILDMPTLKEMSNTPKGNREKSIIFFGDTEKSKAHKGDAKKQATVEIVNKRKQSRKPNALTSTTR